MTHRFDRFGTTIVMVFWKQPIKSVRIAAAA
jgi:hypothetical protein